MSTKPIILVTNDDGITSPGIKHLIERGQKFGRVVVVAPDSPQSGKGHAITLEEPLRIRKVNLFHDVEAYECSGTPVDCVKLAKHVIFKEENIGLCISGINHGSNAGINIIYSGTMSAAMEAALEGINSIGFSHVNYSYNIDFSPANKYIDLIIEHVIKNGLEGGKLLNVNIPNMEEHEIKGIKMCIQGESQWEEEFVEGKDPRNIPYYWLAGAFKKGAHDPQSDIWALENGYISIVPSKHDLTDYDQIDSLKILELDE